MISLRDYIYESVLDAQNPEIAIKNAIRGFLKNTYKGRCIIRKTPDTDGKYIVDCNGDLIIKNFVGCPSITNGLFKFGSIKGNFQFHGTSETTSLEGGPEEVGGICRYYNVNVETLEGSPKRTRSFECSSNNLISLKGCPMEVNEFDITSPKLSTLKDSPKSVETYNCSRCTNLSTLEGLPNNVKNLYCINCTGLKSFKGCPDKLRVFSIDNCWQFGQMDITKVNFPKRVETIHNGNCGWLGEDIIKVCDFDTCTHSIDPKLRTTRR